MGDAGIDNELGLVEVAGPGWRIVVGVHTAERILSNIQGVVTAGPVAERSQGEGLAHLEQGHHPGHVMSLGEAECSLDE